MSAVRFKLDENMPAELAAVFRRSGHDAATVAGQGLSGAKDSELASVCSEEGRTIVTFDMGFADIRAYPPRDYPGIVVFRLANQERDHVLEIGRRFLKMLSLAPFPPTSLDGKLWIVGESRVRAWG